MRWQLALLVLTFASVRVSGHGRLVEPPSRSSMWRFGFKTKPNYNDNELFCGGYTVHWQRNGGKCGVCGDAWHLPQPRPNEAGGIYGRGIIVRRYTPGQVITSTLDITANHRGFFEFKLCPHNSPTTIVSQDCLDSYPLELADGSGTKYYPTFGTKPFNVQLKLPDHVTCSQCVFQWTYTAGNNWGKCENGSSKVGCGPQETFRGCADVAIDDRESNDIPLYEAPPSAFGPSITAIPSKRPSARPRPTPRSRPTRPNRRRPTTTKPSRRPYYNRRPPSTYNQASTTKKPSTIWWQPPSTKRWFYMSTRRPPVTRRPTQPRKRPSSPSPRSTTPRPKYTEKMIYRPGPSITKKSRPTHKPKPPVRKPPEETGNNGWSCRAVGVWQNVSGIASWCEINCPRGYCPKSHCDCDRRK